jgi:trk system potassium uptake protein
MNFCILGLGAFGTSIAKELALAGHQVLAVDNDESHVDVVKDVVTLAVQGDATDRGLLLELGVEKYDAAIVAVGENFEASLMMTAHLKQIGVKNVFTRVFHEVQEQLLDLMQVTGKVRVEALAAESFARCLSNASFLRHFVVDRTHAVVELICPSALVGKSLLESEMRTRYQVNLVTVRRMREGKADAGEPPVIDGLPGPDFVFQEGDRLVVYGLERDICKFSS